MRTLLYDNMYNKTYISNPSDLLIGYIKRTTNSSRIVEVKSEPLSLSNM